MKNGKPQTLEAIEAAVNQEIIHKMYERYAQQSGLQNQGARERPPQQMQKKLKLLLTRKA